MYYNTNYSSNSRMNNNNDGSMSYVRVLHAVPDAPNVDIYANENLIASDLAFGEYTDYIPVPEGTYEVSLYVAGTEDSPVIANMLTLAPNSIVTVAAVDTLDNISFLAITDSNLPIDQEQTMIRFAHLSPDAPAVDITLPDGTVLLGDVSFKQLTPYIEVPPNTYTLEVRVAGTPDVVLTVPDIRLEENMYYSAYAIGLAGDEPELEALLLTDRNPHHHYNNHTYNNNYNNYY